MCLYARDVKSKEFWNLPNTWISTYFQSEQPSALFGAIVLYTSNTRSLPSLSVPGLGVDLPMLVSSPS